MKHQMSERFRGDGNEFSSVAHAEDSVDVVSVASLRVNVGKWYT